MSRSFGRIVALAFALTLAACGGGGSAGGGGSSPGGSGGSSGGGGGGSGTVYTVPAAESLSAADVGTIVAHAAAQAVDELMPRNRPDPWAERLRLDPCVPLQVDGDQRFLHDILDFDRTARTRGRAAQHGAQRRRQLLEQHLIGGSIAGVGRSHQRRPLVVALLHRASQLIRWNWVDCYHANADFGAERTFFAFRAFGGQAA